LGNPGAEYHHTRHNVGFRAIDLLAECHKIDTRKTEKRAFVGYGKIGDVAVVLAKPITFMNLSGESIAPLLRMLELTPADLIVVYDDMDLPVGRIRVRPDGSAGGHNGIKSLIHHLRTQEFPRIKIGVGRPGVSGPTTDHVLGKFVRSELEPIQSALARATEAVEVMVAEGTVAAMNRFNPSPTSPPPTAGPLPE
jgi:PTH1 family peptidyl-tRNA hydrolase